MAFIPAGWRFHEEWTTLSAGNIYAHAAGDFVGGDVTIKGGTFTVGGDASGNGNSVIESNGGNIVIEDGFFYTDYAYRNFYYVLNQQNGNSGTVTVKVSANDGSKKTATFKIVVAKPTEAPK